MTIDKAGRLATWCRAAAGVLAPLLCAVVPAASALAQETAPGPVARLFSHVDVGVGAAYVFTKNSSGTNYLNQPVSLSPSSTVGALVQLRYTASPRVGLEYTYSYARFTENFSYTAINSGGATPTAIGIQANVSEYSFGYLAHTREEHFGVKPFAAVGGGVLAFRPSKNGGASYTSQARGAFYYTVGAEQSVFNPHIGLRAQFRQVFYTAPDFKTNYLQINARTFTTEPSVGFYLHF